VQAFAVSVFLDQRAGEEPTLSWKQFETEYNQIENAHSANAEKEAAKVTVNLRVRCQESQTENTGETRHVFYDRHGGAVGNYTLNFEKDAYIWFDKLSPDFVRIFRKDPPRLLPFQLMEAGLLRVLVIDERIAEIAGRDPGLDDADRAKLGQILVGLGQAPATAWHFAHAARVLVCTSLSWGKKLLHWKYTERDLCKVTVAEGEIKCEVDGRKQPYRHTDIDVCIVHQGILDDLEGGPEVALKVLQGLVPFVVVDSGRGIPPGLPKTQKFLPFSILDDWIGQRTGKLVLSQLLMQLSRRTDEFA